MPHFKLETTEMRWCEYCRAQIRSEHVHVWEAEREETFERTGTKEILDLHTGCVSNWLKKHTGWSIKFLRTIH